MKPSSLLEHWLIPSALLSANVGLVHLIYLFANPKDYISVLAVSLCLLLMASGVIRKIRYQMIIGMIIYWLVFLGLGISLFGQ